MQGAGDDIFGHAIGVRAFGWANGNPAISGCFQINVIKPDTKASDDFQIGPSVK